MCAISINKFKVGDKVRVIKKIEHWKGITWNNQYMDKTLGKVYEIMDIASYGHMLNTSISFNNQRFTDFWYSYESLQAVGEQLLFDFMKEQNL